MTDDFVGMVQVVYVVHNDSPQIAVEVTDYM